MRRGKLYLLGKFSPLSKNKVISELILSPQERQRHPRTVECNRTDVIQERKAFRKKTGMTLGGKNKRKVRIFAVCCIFRNYNSKALQSKVNPPIQIVCRGCCKRSFAFGVALCRALETFSISTASTRTNDNNCWHCRTGRMILNAILGGDR